MTTASTKPAGGCLCGGVRYAIAGPLRGVIACHCAQCRRTSGHYAAMTSALSSDIVLTSSGSLTWYRSSSKAERGFCGTCGSNLFWRQFDRDTTSITAGTLDTPTGIAMEQHIFVADKSDYYTLDDDLPKLPAW
ncbi:MAG TPA: GFA family protein [Steroidobacteraceae bacterium]|nr:GFA family protein [Steroidobacteraceae bacterium]